MTLGFGFTVDDALISTRVAHHLNAYGHYGFNPDGVAVDCVTPLGWAWLLMPFSSSGPWAGFRAAQVIGALAAASSALILGRLVSEKAPSRGWGLRVTLTAVVLATSLPFGAWATSGMETSVAMLLCTGAVWGFDNRHWVGPIAAGFVAALRPELAPWAVVIASLGDGPLQPAANELTQQAVLRRATHLSVVLLPALGVFAVRYFVFGSAVPLAVAAKPSDGAHGWTYVWGALRFLGFPLLLVGKNAFARLPRTGKALAAALLAHTLTVVGVGGDWMSLFRLFVPIVPAGLWLALLVMGSQSRNLVLAKGILAIGANGILIHSLGASSRQVVAARRELMDNVAPLLVDARALAALDVGWVGAATDRPITDLAGVTDPEIAYLPGGHTSKRLPTNLLARRHVDTLVLLLAPGHPRVNAGDSLNTLRFARIVENALIRQDGADEFYVSSVVALRGTTQHYVVLQRHGDRTQD